MLNISAGYTVETKYDDNVVSRAAGMLEGALTYKLKRSFTSGVNNKIVITEKFMIHIAVKANFGLQTCQIILHLKSKTSILLK